MGRIAGRMTGPDLIIVYTDKRGIVSVTVSVSDYVSVSAAIVVMFTPVLVVSSQW